MKFEKRAIRLLGLPEKRRNPSQRLDTVVAGLDVDLKFTLGRTWMIPPEVVGAWCLLAALDHPARSYSVGLLKVTEDALTRGANRDAKRSVGRTGMGRIRWLGRGVRLPDA